MRIVHVALPLVLVLLIGLPLSPIAAQDSVPRFEPTDCPFDTEEELEGVECGELVVWENREGHKEGTLRLAVAILRSTADEPNSDPLVFLSGLLGWPLGALVCRLQGRPSPTATGRQRGARWLAALTALIALGFALGLVLAIRDAASVNPLLLAFGVSGDFGWVFLLPWVMAGLTVVVVLASVRSWTEGWWSGWHRIHYGLVAAGCVVFLVVVGLLGLL